jgi:hypothetical protein
MLRGDTHEDRARFLVVMKAEQGMSAQRKPVRLLIVRR